MRTGIEVLPTLKQVQVDIVICRIEIFTVTLSATKNTKSEEQGEKANETSFCRGSSKKNTCAV